MMLRNLLENTKVELQTLKTFNMLQQIKTVFFAFIEGVIALKKYQAERYTRNHVHK